ncbi:energy-coupling factor ABC transporter ATP-binding protein [Azospirillum doebereinerae]|uniref:ATP-binding cassette domain-containing protein n=1 Tax=Azospirillum doebereinerae TaxID=92933 RepID=A0A3S0V467_9PROT|nr:ATP-binding cassette domain-containing protein [Azospirillum doebereinerae]MCG5240980.1 ATP-binding cassette domain-containing protein [Azospirillum doebereinerae]RUQ66588.1 ATP-binding cassette domain-containing protein [Azospirillum doebereinerae]
MIEFCSVTHAYGDRAVLSDLSFRLTERRVAILGGNGSGKSTLARLLNGLLVPTGGSVTVDGLDTRTDGRAVRRKVGFVFQNPDVQIVLPTVEEDVAFGLKARKIPKEEIARRVTAALDRHGLARYRHQPAHQMSGGEKQLLAIAGVLVLEPDHVVFDEPTTLLDLRNRRRVIETIRALPQKAVVVTHDLDMVMDFDRVLVLEDGRVVADAPPAVAVPAYVERLS